MRSRRTPKTLPTAMKVLWFVQRHQHRRLHLLGSQCQHKTSATGRGGVEKTREKKRKRKKNMNNKKKKRGGGGG